MHNGGIADFHLIKRKLQASLSDELFAVPQGNTDSEWAFALFLSFVSGFAAGWVGNRRLIWGCKVAES